MGNDAPLAAELSRWGQFHVTYSNQIAEQRGNIIGGFTCSISTDPACDLGPSYFAVDHDQRDTLNTGFTAQPAHSHLVRQQCLLRLRFLQTAWQIPATGPIRGNYLPAHTTFDLSAGHNIGENWELSGSLLNVTDHRVLLDNSVTIGGFHWNDPRMFYATLRYRFHF